MKNSEKHSKTNTVYAVYLLQGYCMQESNLKINSDTKTWAAYWKPDKSVCECLMKKIGTKFIST